MSETKTAGDGGTPRRPRRIGGFRVLDDRPLGSGAEGLVWRVVCDESPIPGVSPGEIVALKTMSEGDLDGSRFRRLKRRTDELVALNHPNVVRYRGCFRIADEFNDVQAVVMDWLDGETLRDRIKRNPQGLDADEGLEICEKAVAGLAAAAAAGIVHRDVKPSNVFLCRDGSVKVIDFELARSEGGTVSDASGAFMGTFNYMAPEFVDPKFRGDETSDVFSAGVMLHETLTGRMPYARCGRANQPDFDYLERWSSPESCAKALNVSTRASRVLQGLSDVLMRMLKVDRTQRTASFAEVALGLRGVRFSEFRRGDVIYRLLREIGSGGFGEVFKARVLPENRYVAVKHLKDYANGDRFRREARLMQQLKDDHFTQFIDYFETEENMVRHAYIVMDYLPGMPGSSLRDAMHAASQRGRILAADEVIEAFCRYLRGLAVLHEKGVIHRDIKPSNLYYPPGHPERTVIMDMGIARDVNGSITNGQVPGTFDYMPPEVVVRSSDTQDSFRGDAKMDIYAMGLCLFEALTGRQGFKRLPSGDQGLKEFYQRAQRREAPDLSDGELLHRPTFYRLIREMTDPVYERRLGSAAEACRRLSEMNWAADRQDETVVASHPERWKRRDGQVDRDDGPTAPTPPTGRAAPFAWLRGEGARRLLRRTALVAGAAVVVLVGGAVAWEPIASMYQRYLQDKNDKDAQKILRDRNADDAEKAVASVTSAFAAGLEAGEKAVGEWESVWASKPYADGSDVLARCREKVEAARLSAMIRICESEVVRIEEAFGAARSPDEVDSRASDWRRRWEDLWQGHDRAAFDRFALRADAARSRCLERLSRACDIARNEADAVIGAYRTADACAIGDTAADAWRTKWLDSGIAAAVLSDVSNRFEVAQRECAARIDEQTKRDELRRERQRKIAGFLGAAKAEAAQVVAAYEDDTLMSGSVDRMDAAWQNKWGEALTECGSDLEREPEFRQLADQIRSAKDERSLRRRESKIVSECMAIFRTIHLVTAVNVKNWRHDCLDVAEAALAKAERDGYVSAASKRRLEDEIERRRTWCVGVVVNRLHEPVSLLGEKIPALSSQTFVFTNALPAGAALTVDGYVPRPIDARHLDGQVVTVRPDQLVEISGDAILSLPELPEQTVAIVDGTLYAGGQVKVRSGTHEVAFRRLSESTPGTRDFLDVQKTVRVPPGKTTAVALPERWTPNPDAAKARVAAALARRGDMIAEACLKGLEPMPIDTRRSRLEKVHALLSDWNTPPALGDRRMKDLTRRYEEECARAIGYVVSEMDVPAKVKVYDSWISIAPGEKTVVSYDFGFRDGMPKDAYVVVEGYECAFLPPKEDFDGGVYTVAKDLLRPKPVAVEIPALESGVTCRIDGAVAAGTVVLAPGRHAVAYSRDGKSTQRFEFAFGVGEKPPLPPPGEWKNVGFFESACKVVSESVQGGIDAVSKSLENSRVESPRQGGR